MMTMLFLTSPPAASAADYSKYHNYDELTGALRDLVSSHSRIAQLVEIGRTLEGRTVWAVEIANRATTTNGRARP